MLEPIPFAGMMEIDEMNKPVAWIGKLELQFGFTDTKVTNEKESWDDIPLYTHPHSEESVKVKELTDEEWLTTYRAWLLLSNDPLVLKETLRRKAQE